LDNVAHTITTRFTVGDTPTPGRLIRLNVTKLIILARTEVS